MRGRRMKALYVDCFTTLDDLPRKQHGDALVVLRAVMKSGGRFSVFDATQNDDIARSMTFIEGASGWIERATDGCQYPWVTVRLTEKGRAALEQTRNLGEP